MIILVGLPGSGKSTLAKKIIAETGDIYVRVVSYNLQAKILDEFIEISH